MTSAARGLSLRGSPLTDRRVTVMGLGLFGGGAAVARALAEAGARVTVTDLRSEAELGDSVRALADLDLGWTLGEHRPEDFTAADVVVASPAVAPSNPHLELARGAGAAVTSEIELFLEACPARIALVTGTQGKSTTSHIAAGLLCACRIRAHLGGNIGRALIGELARIDAGDVVVLEVSSYQLEALPTELASLSRNVAAVCVTGVLADHLERHGSVEAYEAAKRRALDLAPPRAVLILPADDARVRAWDLPALCTRWFSIRGDAHLCVRDGAFRAGDEQLGRVADVQLKGSFQHANVLAALGLARALGAPASGLAAALADVRGLEHRLQDLGSFSGHRVWDNGVSTTPDSTVSALCAFNGPLTLLCGGQAKDLALDELVATCAARAQRVMTFGASGEALASALHAGGVDVHFAGELADAVREAFAHMEAGETLLFSPACASFDAFLNFEQRVAAFRAALPPLDPGPSRAPGTIAGG